MDIEEFEKKVNPGGKRSRLEVFSAGILRLKSKGYAYHQIQEWVASNGIVISRQAIEHFVRKKERNRQSGILSTTSNQDVPINTNRSMTEKSSPILSREEREKIANQYIKDEPNNPILRKIRKEKEIENSSDEL